MRTTPIPEMARAYGLGPRLWLLRQLIFCLPSRDAIFMSRNTKALKFKRVLLQQEAIDRFHVTSSLSKI